MNIDYLIQNSEPVLPYGVAAFKSVNTELQSLSPKLQKTLRKMPEREKLDIMSKLHTDTNPLVYQNYEAIAGSILGLKKPSYSKLERPGSQKKEDDAADLYQGVD